MEDTFVVLPKKTAAKHKAKAILVKINRAFLENIFEHLIEVCVIFIKVRLLLIK